MVMELTKANGIEDSPKMESPKEAETLSVNEDENSSLYTCCNTNTIKKMYVYMWTINDLWNIYETTSFLRFDPVDGQLPFNIHMECIKEEEKMVFCINCSSAYKFTCSVHLEALIAPWVNHVLPYSNKNEQLRYEVKMSFLTEKSGACYVNNNTLKVFFKFHCIKHILHNTIQMTILCRGAKVNIQNLKSVNSEETVSFSKGSKKFVVNKELLCAKSDYFKCLLSYEENNMPINVVYFSEATIKEFTYYINNNNINSIDLHSPSIIFELNKMAQMYGMKDLQTICEICLKERLFAGFQFQEDTCKFLTLAIENDTSDLIKSIIDFIALNIKVYFRSPDFNSLVKKYPQISTLLEEAKISTREAFCTLK